MSLEILKLTGQATFQDKGRVGFQKFGVSKSGAVDLFALAEGQAVLSNKKNCTALELQLGGGQFKCLSAVWLAATGGEMEIFVDNNPVPWRCAFQIKPGQILTLGKRISGVYSYLHLHGGIDCKEVMGSRSTHIMSDLGECPKEGSVIKAMQEGQSKISPVGLDKTEYLSSKIIRVIKGPQTRYFFQKDINEFEKQTYKMSSKRNRMGARVEAANFKIKAAKGLTLISDPIIEGDIQVPADGIPTILLADCQPTGGYPRIGTVITADIPKIVQLQQNESFHFQFVSRKEAIEELSKFKKAMSMLPRQIKRAKCSTIEPQNLLEHNLISGVFGEND